MWALSQTPRFEVTAAGDVDQGLEADGELGNHEVSLFPAIYMAAGRTQPSNIMAARRAAASHSWFDRMGCMGSSWSPVHDPEAKLEALRKLPVKAQSSGATCS